MLTAPQTLVNIIVSVWRRSFPGGVEHDEAVDGVEGEPEAAQGVAPEADGRALFGAHEQVGRHSAQDERADVDSRRAHASGGDFAARDVARAPPPAPFCVEHAQRARGRLVDREAEAGARVEQGAPAFGEHDEGSPRAALGQPWHDRAVARRVRDAQGARARVEEAQLTGRDVYDKAERAE